MRHTTEGVKKKRNGGCGAEIMGEASTIMTNFSFAQGLIASLIWKSKGEQRFGKSSPPNM